ncbi:MAG: S8 family serine peptidase [Egibacteraceae bacterium]
MSCASSRLFLLAALVIALTLAVAVLPAGALETAPNDRPVAVAAIVETPDGPAVQRHTAASPEQAQTLVAELRTRDDVVTAEIDVRVHSLEEPAAPAQAEEIVQTQAVDPERAEQWALDRLQAETAWTSTHADGQVVAIVDSGVDADHPDLQDLVIDGFDALDVGTLGKVDPLTPCSGTCRGHGTHVAGVVAALVGNDIGIAGLARGASIMPVRVLDPAGFGDSSDVAEGIMFAADHGADVINLSLGSIEPSQLVEFAVAYATRHGALVVAAAGNHGRYSPDIHPAVDPWTLAVGATDRDDTVASFSGQGTWIDLVAPGVDILSTRPVSAPALYSMDSGTSMATPHVAAAAALVRRRHPSLSPTGVAAHLRATATDLSPGGRDRTSGDGLVDPVAALSRSPAGQGPCDAPRTPSSGFRDVGSNSHGPAIDCVYWFQVTQGATATTYAPAGQVTRGQMASFIARMLTRSGVELPTFSGHRFSDVSAHNVHRTAINSLASVSIVEGHNGAYAPNEVVTRDQMASFLVRSHDYAQGQVSRASLPAASRQFGDIAGNAHESNINKAAVAGLANGVTTLRYAPRQGVRRDQMATFVTRTMERFASQ